MMSPELHAVATDSCKIMIQTSGCNKLALGLDISLASRLAQFGSRGDHESFRHFMLLLQFRSILGRNVVEQVFTMQHKLASASHQATTPFMGPTRSFCPADTKMTSTVEIDRHCDLYLLCLSCYR